jgi:hypothetical protein
LICRSARGRSRTSRILLISGAHDWHRPPDQGRQGLGDLYRQLTAYRKEPGDELAVILSG